MDTGRGRTWRVGPILSDCNSDRNKEAAPSMGETLANAPRAASALRASIRFDLIFVTTLFILFLVFVSGHFTFQGLKAAYGDNVLLSLAIAFAIQCTIFLALIYFPRLGLLGRVLCVGTYMVAAIFSIIFAFIYLYATAYGDTERRGYQRETAAELQSELAGIAARENQLLVQARADAAEIKNKMELEYETGFYSGQGPGEGPIYFGFKGEYEAALKKIAILEAETALFQQDLARLNEELGSDDFRIAAVTPLIASLVSHCNSCAKDTAAEGGEGGLAGQMIRMFSQRTTALPSSFDAAFRMLMTKYEERRVWITALQASLFDFLAFFVGLFRALLIMTTLERRRNLVSRIIRTIESWRRLRRYVVRAWRSPIKAQPAGASAAPLPAGALALTPMSGPGAAGSGETLPAALAAGEAGGLAADFESALDPDRRITRFIAEMVATCQTVAWSDAEILAPLKTIIQKLEVVEGKSEPTEVGIRRSEIRSSPRMNPVASVLVRHQVLVPDKAGSFFMLNADPEHRDVVEAFYRLAATEAQQALEILHGVRSAENVARAFRGEDDDKAQQPRRWFLEKWVRE